MFAPNRKSKRLSTTFRQSGHLKIEIRNRAEFVPELINVFRETGAINRARAAREALDTD